MGNSLKITVAASRVQNVGHTFSCMMLVTQEHKHWLNFDFDFDFAVAWPSPSHLVTFYINNVYV